MKHLPVHISSQGEIVHNYMRGKVCNTFACGFLFALLVVPKPNQNQISHAFSSVMWFRAVLAV